MWLQSHHSEESIPKIHRQILIYLWGAFLGFAIAYCILEYYNFQELKRSQKSVDIIYTHPLNVSNAAEEALGYVYQSELFLTQIIHANTKRDKIDILNKLFTIFNKTINSMMLIHEHILGEEGKALEAEATRMMIQWHNIGFVIGESIHISDWRRINEEFYKQKPLVKELEKTLIALNKYARDNASLMLNESQKQVDAVRQSMFIRIGIFGLIATMVFGMILLKVYEVLKNSRKITHSLTRANQLIKESHTILIVWENKPGWPVSYVSSNIFQLGYRKEEVLDPSWVYENIIHPECLTNIMKEVEEHISNGDSRFMQVYRIRKKDGEYRWIQDHTQVIRDKKGNVLRLEGVLTDINELKEMELSLKEKDEMMIAQSRHAAMGEMISMIAHQWRQPLAVISMSADNMLLDIEFDDMNADQFKEGAEGIISQTQYLSQTIDDFRDFFKPNKEAEACIINVPLTEVLGIIGPSLKSHNISVTRELHSTTAISTFPKELVQVGINLVKNAKEVLLDEGVENPCIVVETKEDEEHVYLYVCDNGPGIPDEIRPRIFEPYFTTKNAKEGTGLGLYMSKTIVEKHLLGKLRVTSKPGNTCFEVVLPKKRLDTE